MNKKRTHSWFTSNNKQGTTKVTDFIDERQNEKDTHRRMNGRGCCHVVGGGAPVQSINQNVLYDGKTPLMEYHKWLIFVYLSICGFDFSVL